MSKKVFFTTLAKALGEAGFETKVDIWYLHVAGVQFDADETEFGVRFLDSNFTIKGGDFNRERAIGLIIKELPRRLKAKQAETLFKELRGDAKYHSFSGLMSLYVITPNVDIGNSSLGVSVVYTSTNKEKLQKALEFLKSLDAAPVTEEVA